MSLCTVVLCAVLPGIGHVFIETIQVIFRVACQQGLAGCKCYLAAIDVTCVHTQIQAIVSAVVESCTLQCILGYQRICIDSVFLIRSWLICLCAVIPVLQLTIIVLVPLKDLVCYRHYFSGGCSICLAVSVGDGGSIPQTLTIWIRR